MQVSEGSDLTFEIPAIFTDLEYDLVIRHEHLPEDPNEWKEANVELIRIDGPPDPTGKCKDAQDGKIPFSMSPDQLYTEITPPLCLEEGQRYELKFTFDHYDPAAPSISHNILIDSIALIPKTDVMDIFEDPSEPALALKTAYEDNACRDQFVDGARANITDECKDILKSISMFAFDGGFTKTCDCNPTGSKSSLCDKYSGQCECKKNVAGRKCQRCQPGFYGFGADGCIRKFYLFFYILETKLSL